MKQFLSLISLYIVLFTVGCNQVPKLKNDCDLNSRSNQDKFLSQQILSTTPNENKLLLKVLFSDIVFECAYKSNSTSTDNSTRMTSISYPTDFRYLVQNSAITAITPTILGGTPKTCSASPTLPNGLSLDQSTCSITGIPTVGTTLTTYTVTATNTVSSITGTTTFKVNFTAPKFVFFGHFGSNDISRFSINATSGALSNLGANSGLGGARKGRDLSPDPLGRYLYSATFDGGDVGSQVIQSDGTLSAATFVAQANNSESITVDPAGKYVYSVGTTGSFVAAYTANQTTGNLTFVNSVATGLTSRWIRVHPNGNFAYVMDGTAGFETIRVYSINSSTGGLTASSTFTLTTPGTPEQLAIHPTGSYLYSSDRTASKFRKFNVDSSTGVISGEQVFSALPFGPEHLVVSPSGKYLYVAGQSSTTVRLYSIDGTTGALTFVIDFTATNNVSDLVIDPSENFLIASNYGTALYQVLRISSTDGTLTSVASGSTSGTGTNTIGVTGSN